jgi:hypothetical protein
LERYYKCSYTVFNKYLQSVRFYPACNGPSLFNIVNDADYEDILKLHKMEAVLPIYIDQIAGKGNGIRANRNIKAK